MYVLTMQIFRLNNCLTLADIHRSNAESLTLQMMFDLFNYMFFDQICKLYIMRLLEQCSLFNQHSKVF